MVPEKTLSLIAKRLPQRDLITPVELALALGIASTRPIYKAIRRGELPALRIGRSTRIARSGALNWLMSINNPARG